MKIQRDYRQKSEMNLETNLVLTFFGLKQKFQAFILTGAVRDNIETNDGEWQGFVSQVKSHTKQSEERLRTEMRDMRAEMQTEMRGMQTDMKSMMDILKEIQAQTKV